jgi:hypothetical protein
MNRPSPTRAQTRRLREIYRSAGWPCQDSLELELLAAGWLERLREPDGRERLRLSDAGVHAAVEGLGANRKARDAHELLVQRVATELQRAGRVVWTGLSLRAGLARDDEPERLRWLICQPDVYSLRQTSKPEGLEVAIHEIKATRADLLTELRKPDKSAAYAALSGQTCFVLAAGIAEVDEIPAQYGVWFAHPTHFELARPAPRRAHYPDFASWMALARSHALAGELDGAQGLLGATGGDGDDALPL